MVPSNARNLYIAGAALAVAFGLSCYFLTGWDFAFSVALWGGGVYTLREATRQRYAAKNWSRMIAEMQAESQAFIAEMQADREKHEKRMAEIESPDPYVAEITKLIEPNERTT